MATIVTTNKDKRNVQCNPASSFPLMVIGSAVGALTSVNHLGLSNDNELTGLLCKIVLSVAFFPEMAEWLTCLPDHRQSHVLLNVRPRSTAWIPRGRSEVVLLITQSMAPRNKIGERIKVCCTLDLVGNDSGRIFSKITLHSKSS